MSQYVNTLRQIPYNTLDKQSITSSGYGTDHSNFERERSGSSRI
jgi:hypothetical protein